MIKKQIILLPAILTTLALAITGCVSDYADPYPLLGSKTDQESRTIPVFPMNMVGEAEAAPQADTDDDLGIPNLLRRDESYEMRGIDLREVRDSIVNNNLGLRSDRYSAAATAEQIGTEQGRFAAVLGVKGGFSKSVNSATSVVSPSGSIVNQSPGLTTDLTLPLATGGSLELSSKIYEYRQNSKNIDTLSGPPSSSGAFNSLVLSASQPLLRGAGTTVALAPIVLADYEARQSSANVTISLLSTLSQAEVQYWQTWVSGKVMEIRETSRDLAVDQLELTESLLAKGQATIVDVEVARASVFSQIQQMVQAEQNFVVTALDLQTTLNMPDLPLDGTVLVLPDEEPSLPTISYELPELLALALDNRLELLQLELEVASDVLQIDVARNGTLPQFDIGGEFGVTGITAGGPSQAIKDSFDGSQPFPWSIGFTGSVNLDNQSADSTLRAAVLDRLSSIADLGSQKLTIKNDVLTAVANLRVAETQIRLSQRSAIAYQQAYDGTVQLFKLGQQDANDVANALENLAQALSGVVTQYGAYQEAVVQLAAATGTNLGMNGIEWDLPTGGSGSAGTGSSEN